MNVTDFQEIWQVDAGGQIYEANFEAMAHWIFEGSLLPQDLVKRGNLRWIEARKVPALLNFFNAKEQGMPLPVFATTTDGQATVENAPAQTQNFVSPPTISPHPYQTTINQPPVENSVPPKNPFYSPPSNQNFNSNNNWQEPNFSPQTQNFNQLTAA